MQSTFSLSLSLYLVIPTVVFCRGTITMDDEENLVTRYTYYIKYIVWPYYMFFFSLSLVECKASDDHFNRKQFNLHIKFVWTIPENKWI